MLTVTSCMQRMRDCCQSKMDEVDVADGRARQRRRSEERARSVARGDIGRITCACSPSLRGNQLGNHVRFARVATRPRI